MQPNERGNENQTIEFSITECAISEVLQQRMIGVNSDRTLKNGILILTDIPTNLNYYWDSKDITRINFIVIYQKLQA